VVDPNEAQEAEYALTVAQAFLALGCLLAIYIDPIGPRPYTRLARLALLLYASFSLLMVEVLRRQSDLNRSLRLVLHVTGVFWTGVAFLFTKAGGGPIFVVFLLFIVLAAAYRWGLVQTLSRPGAVQRFFCWSVTPPPLARIIFRRSAFLACLSGQSLYSYWDAYSDTWCRTKRHVVPRL
jgi:hypothetical protein